MELSGRDPKTGRFLPGSNPNPGGRVRSDLSITALIDKAVSPDDWDFIIRQMLKMARRGNLKAIEMLTDRRFGKPLQPQDIDAALNIRYVNDWRDGGEH